MDADVIIAGGGLVGASAACALAGAGLSVTLLEPRPRLQETPATLDSRVYAINPGSARFLAECGIWERIPARRREPVRAMVIVGDDAAARLQFSAYEARVPELAHIVEGQQLQFAAETVAASKVQWIESEACAEVSVTTHDVQVTTTTGRHLRGKLLLAADGSDSPIREQLGMRAVSKSYDQSGVVANFRAPLPHRGIAHQWFGNGDVLALLPLPDQHLSMVWSVDSARAVTLCGLAAADLVRELNRATRDVAGALELVTESRAFPLRRMRVDSVIGDRVALLGDAAHNVHPLAGQGLNLGLADAAVLARVVSQRGAEQDCGARELLRRYERARKEDVLAMEVVTDGLHSLFRNPRFAWLRNRGLALTNRLAFVKGVLVERALG
jgi:2-polyprenylphenol 6-hydroxylase